MTHNGNETGDYKKMTHKTHDGNETGGDYKKIRQ